MTFCNRKCVNEYSRKLATWKPPSCIHNGIRTSWIVMCFNLQKCPNCRQAARSRKEKVKNVRT